MTIIIPTPLRQYVDGQSKIEVNAPTVRGAMDALTLDRPELRKHLFNAEGKIRAFVNIYLNDEDVRYLPQKEDSAVLENDTLTIIPSIAGGCKPSAVIEQL
ncbi:MoaD/ThiS family protein [Occallatibacter riparius]|uniref:MoaD/ThiS family protein n=1 Tax=Occallatibacter riparius TaxID=1002689 RepID=A0A9J7BR87_9BACT|nr:MoaD/ThiS family protein [Occallatibacter riparius]UWZ84266.1 MoaD/ThiS family protein [Occallatibacter riparius]